MTSDGLTKERSAGPRIRRRMALVTIALIALVALFVLLGAPELLKPTGESKDGGDLGGLVKALEKIEGPGLAVFGTLSGLGLVAGGAMTAMGMQQGIRIMLTAGLAGGGVLLGKGLIQ